MKIMKLLITLYVIPFIIVPIYFNKLIPSLFEISGYTFVYMEKLTFSFFYLPIWGLLLSIICIKLSKNSILINKIILMSIFFIITIKLGIPSMKIILYNNYNKNIRIIDIINNIELYLFRISIITLGIGIYLFLKNRIPISEYKYAIKKILNIKK